MRLSSKDISIQNLSNQLGPLIKEHSLDLMVGSLQTTRGVLVLLFSHRLNKEIPVVVTGTHDLPKVANEIRQALEIP